MHVAVLGVILQGYLSIHLRNTIGHHLRHSGTSDLINFCLHALLYIITDKDLYYYLQIQV